MFSNEIVKKIVYAIEQTAGARWSMSVDKIDPPLEEALDEAMAALRAALIAASAAE